MATKERVNIIGLERADYKGRPSTLCKGCGHDSITSRIIEATYDLGINPTQVAKMSGIGCSSKTPAYYLGYAHGFNGTHGRMPAFTTGAVVANRHLKAIGVSGDGDTGSIGMGQFKHAMRRNLPMVYIVENNGVYGLTKGQFSATSDEGQTTKYYGENDLRSFDLCLEAVVSGATFVARSFAGDPKQATALIKAALNHRGIAFIDIISPCVTFNDHETSNKSFSYGKKHEDPLHDISFVMERDEITIDDYEPGEVKLVEMHDGGVIQLRKLDENYDPADKMAAMRVLEHAHTNQEFITGLIYLNQDQPNFVERENMVDTALAHLPDDKLRPDKQKLEAAMDEFRY